MSSLVFVYGTLKKNYGNHHFLETSKFVSRAITVNKFTMVCNGSFPFVGDKEQVTTIQGEVYEVDDQTMDNLDSLEGAHVSRGIHTLYDRKTTEVKLEDGTIVTVFIYIANPRINLSSYEKVSRGVWFKPNRQVASSFLKRA